ncbi:MAG: nuclear transport factor 2 family protein [Sulfurimonas sp.]|nr:nuclear transport factor 2 family protein [Sulfurimonas sp.]
MDTKLYAEAYANFYAKMNSSTSKEEYETFFDAYSYFEDPFQRVYGIDNIYAIFVDMYKKLHEPVFIIDEVVCSDNVAYIRWEFRYSLSPKHARDSFIGLSRVTFEDAKVVSHIDYWDAAQHVYEKIPLLGSVLRFIKRKVHA